MSRLTREMFCLMEGRHVHPSTLYPGGVGTVPTVQLFTDYLVRLMKYVEFMKKVVPLHDDLFDFFYEALPGYEEVGRRRVLLGCWGSFQNPEVCDFDYKTMTDWGRAMYVTPGVVVDGKLVTTDLVDINLGIRILLGQLLLRRLGERRNLRQERPARQSGRSPASVESDDHPSTAETRFPQELHLGHVAALVRQADRYAPGPGYRRRPASPASGPPPWPGLVDIGYVKATGHSVKIYLPKTTSLPETEFEWKIPKWSNTIERDRARTYFQAYSAAAALYFVEQGAAPKLHAGRTQTWTDFKVPKNAIGCGFHEAVRGVLSHHVVIRDGKIANYHPYPPDAAGTPAHATAMARPGPTKTPCRTRRSSRRMDPTTSRASTSCAPCAASIPACRAAFTCTSVPGKRSRCHTCRRMVFRGKPGTLFLPSPLYSGERGWG